MHVSLIKAGAMYGQLNYTYHVAFVEETSEEDADRIRHYAERTAFYICEAYDTFVDDRIEYELRLAGFDHIWEWYRFYFENMEKFSLVDLSVQVDTYIPQTLALFLHSGKEV